MIDLNKPIVMNIYDTLEKRFKGEILGKPDMYLVKGVTVGVLKPLMNNPSAEDIRLTDIKAGRIKGIETEMAYIRMNKKRIGVMLNRRSEKCKGCDVGALCDNSYLTAGLLSTGWLYIGYALNEGTCLTVDLPLDKEGWFNGAKDVLRKSMKAVIGAESAKEGVELAEEVVKAYNYYLDYRREVIAAKKQFVDDLEMARIERLAEEYEEEGATKAN